MWRACERDKGYILHFVVAARHEVLEMASYLHSHENVSNIV